MLTCVRGNFRAEMLLHLRLAVLVEVPRAIRIQRVQNRSLDQFGDRMLPGGDLCEQESAFLQQVLAHGEEKASDSSKTA